MERAEHNQRRIQNRIQKWYEVWEGKKIKALKKLRLARDSKINKDVLFGNIRIRKKTKKSTGPLQGENGEMVIGGDNKAELLNSFNSFYPCFNCHLLLKYNILYFNVFYCVPPRFAL